MRKFMKWIGLAALTPILLFIILAALLYLPPVQNWAVQKVVAYASEKTGMEISVERVNLDFPLDLGIEGFRALHPNDSLPNISDTIADIRRMVVDIQLLPLLKNKVMVDELSFIGAKLNTNGFISDVRIKGELQELWLSANGIDLDKEVVEITGGRLSDARLDIALSDTAAVDTTESTVKWKVNADSLSFQKTLLTLHLPGDTLNLQAYLGNALASETKIDLGANTYLVESLIWRNGRLKYDNRFEPDQKGFDYNHIALSDISLKFDKLACSPEGISFYIGQLAMKEKCGLAVNDMKGGIRLDSAYNHIHIPAMTLKTPDSDIFARLELDFNAFDAQDPGMIEARLNAQIGKQDLMRFMGDIPQKFVERYPNHPISIKGSVSGNMEQADFMGLDISLPTAFHLTVNGKAENIAESEKLKTDLSLNANIQNVNFLLALAAPKLLNDYHIPNGINIDGKVRSDKTHFMADLNARESNSTLKMKADINIPQDARGEMTMDAITYDADISISNLNLHHFMPKDSIYSLSADIRAKGYGTDLMSSRSRLDTEAIIRQLQYGSWNLTDISALVNLQNGHAQVCATSQNEFLDGSLGIDALLDSKKISGTVNADFAKADLFQLRIVGKPLAIGLRGKLDVTSDMKLSHRVSGLLTDFYIKDEKTTYHPDKIGILVNTRLDTTYVRAQSGDFIVKLDASGNYERLMKQFSVLSDSIMAQFEDRVIDQPAIKRLLPTMVIHIESKRENPVANLLESANISFKELLIDVSTSPVTGINGKSLVYSLNYDSIRLDTIRLNLTQKGDRMTYQGQIRNNKRNPQFVFNTLVDGHVHSHGALFGIRFFDDRDRLGVRIGATAEMESDGICLKLLPERPMLAYKDFNLNKDNYIFLSQDKKIHAKVDLVSDDQTGLKLYTENQDSTMLQDITLSLNRIDLGRLTSVVPYLPRITGKLSGDYHILQNREENISVASDMMVENMAYEGSSIGNISSEFVYMMKEDNTHAIDARLLLEDEEFGLLSGTYQSEGEGHLDAVFTMTRMPLSLANGFIPDQIIGFEGYCEGSLAIKGKASNPLVDGEVFVEDAYLISQPYGIRMRFDNDPLRIVGSHLLIENFGLYAYNDEPLNMMGDVDFSNLDNITMDMRMRARNLLLINAKQEAKSITFGKAFVNFAARMQGPLESLQVRGRLDVLGSTDITYMLLDSPLSTDNRLNELVKFTDFSDSTQTVVVRPVPTGLEADLTISISQGAHIVCDLNAEQTNYVDLTGGGDLRMRYNSEGINLTGRYTLTNGEMKYSLPVIPLKTFTVENGSYVEFTGDPMNPKLNIKATERTKAIVMGDDGQGRSVLFNCGVVITKTLNDMGLEFIINAPEDQSVNSELEMMSAEERGKTAVTMLTTGMYLADGNTGGFTMNSALSSFLQSEINNIAGSALKTLDLSVGIDNTTDASGSMHTDYSFRFSKRFLNNRLKIELGGKVSSGSGDMGQDQSFFDNVTMEYRLNQEGTQNLKLFYKQNVYDWLEGYTGEYGIGFVWRRKLDRFWDIFTIWKKTPQQAQLPMMRPTVVVRDSSEIRTDSLKVKQ